MGGGEQGVLTGSERKCEITRKLEGALLQVRAHAQYFTVHLKGCASSL